jgi:hypothetical protein
MSDLFSLPPQVTTPLALVGMLTAGLFIVYKAVLTGKGLHKQKPEQNSEIIKTALDRLFLLLFTALILFFAFLMTGRS